MSLTPKIQRWILLEDQQRDFTSVDYIRELTVRLQPERTFVKGELQVVEFFADAQLEQDGSITYSDRVVREDYSYTRDPDGFALYRDLTITWYAEDDSVVATKVRRKYYTVVERLQEGKRRRANIIDDLQISVLGMIAATEQVTIAAAEVMGTAFMQGLQAETALFIDTGTVALKDAIVADTATTWLDNDVGGGVTIRDVMVDQLTY